MKGDEPTAGDHDVTDCQEQPRLQVVGAGERPQVDTVHEHVQVVDDAEHRWPVRKIDGQGGDIDAREILQPLKPDWRGNRDRKLVAEPREASRVGGEGSHGDPDQVW